MGPYVTYSYVSSTDDAWLFRNLSGEFHASGLITPA